MSFITTKFYEILVEQFQRSYADKKNKIDGLTDCMMDRSNTLYPPQLVAWGIITYPSMKKKHKIFLVK